MKIKYIILFMLVMVSFKTSAKTTFDNIKLMQLYLDKNQLEKVEDLYDEEEETLGKNWMALERLAISFERREKLKEAVEIYRKIITNFNQEAHQKVLNTPEGKLDSTVYDKTKLSLYYYKLAFLNTQLFNKTNDYTPPSERNKYKKNAEGFIALGRKVKVDEAELKLLEDQLQEKLNNDDSLAYKTGWYVSLDLISWQDRLYLVDQSTGVKTDLLSTAMGSCLGGGRKWENIKYEFNFEGCFAVATASISSESTAVKYQQSSVSVKGFMAGPGMYFKTISDNVLLGVQLPVKYRQGDWTNPDETRYRFEREKTFEAGFFLQSKIKIKKVALRTRLGKVFPNPGSLWSVGLLYDF
ncbi:hypothetical protein SHI21_11820 [Bacteriovorax sp. PP10]|uniref:Uncharacterized protein n=1 Tax=Bacteriovorax antarcticus TaxID=3088717 RepID=A0ABU5VV34_9BACT|nr:hypothetical protein [Bacteriovorax sp. PP10]MEA9356901.1 hypothetical protein [Bacteriovorax sp. PP10]